MKILAIAGSLRKNSFNAQLAAHAQAYYKVKGTAEMELLDYADVPMLNQDIEFPVPEPIARIRAKVIEADAIWFFTPEYNHAVPGVLKNLIDWLSRPTAPGQPAVLLGKPAGISGASPGVSGTLVAQDQLLTLLAFIGMNVMASPRTGIPKVTGQADADEKLTLTSSKAYFEKQADVFLEYIVKNK